jgi:hypothetical protein
MALRLTQTERSAISFAAASLAPGQRVAFEETVRSEISRLPPMCRGEGSLHRTIAACQRTFLRVNELAVGPAVAKPRGRKAK